MASDDPRQLTTDRVKEILRRRILSGELAPGARLREMQIARELETSQAPVREALKELEARELVVTEAYKGTYVREITHRDMVEAYHVRAALEEVSGIYAAPRVAGKAEALREAAERAEAMAAEENLPGYAHADYDLHRGIVQAAGNRLLLRSWDALAFETRIEMLLRSCTIDFARSVSEHREIVTALEQGSGREAAKLLRAHCMRFVTLLEKA